MQNKPRESSENNFMALLNFIVDPAVIVDEKGHLLLINNALKETTGLSEKEVIGKAFLELNLLPPKSKEIILENLKKRMQGLPVEPYEIAFTDKTGETRYAEVKAKKIDCAGQHADLVIFRDITRRKKNLAKLKEYSEKMEALVNEKVKEVKESEERYRELTESISDVFFAMDKDLRYTYWNKASEKLTGILAKDAVGKSLTEVFPNAKGTRVEQYYREVLRTKQSRSFLNSHKVGDKEFVFEISGYPTMAGLSVFVKDITERKQAEESLEKEQRDLDCIVDSSPTIIFFKDKEGRFIRVNKTFAEAVKIPKEDFLGKTVFDFYSAKIAQGMANDDSEVLKSGRPKLGIIEQYESAKGMRWVQTDKVPIFDKNSNPVGLVGFAQDITEQKKAEEELKESEEKMTYERDLFNVLMDNIPDAIYFKDTKSRFIRVNRASCLGLGIKDPEEAIGMSDFDFAPEELAKQFYADDQLVMKSGKPIISKEEVMIDKISRKWYSATKVPIKDKNNKVIGLVGISRNITEWKKAQQAVVESEEKFRGIVENSNDVVMLTLPDGTVSYMSPACFRVLGYNSEDLVGTRPAMFHPDDIGKVTKTLAKALNGERGSDLEYRIITKTGETRWVSHSWSPILENGQVKFVVSIVGDITERKKMEADVKQKLDMLEALTENLGVGFTIITKDYHVLWANRFIKNNVGNVEGKLCYSSLNTLDHICPDCGVRKVFEDGVAKDSHEYSNVGVHGNPYHVELIATPLKDKDGNVTAALEFVVDIAEKKRMQRELAEYSQKLEQLVAKRTEELEQTQAKLLKAEKLVAIGELAGMVGHDLRNPLTGIKGAAYYLKTKYAAKMDATGKEMLKIIEKAIGHSNKIINDLLEYSSKLRLDLTETTPKSLLKHTLSIIEVPERIQIMDTTKGKPKIKVDIENISKVFANIITNAIDAMPGTGTLTITSKAAKDNVKIVFKDTGTGMTEETLSKLELGVPLFTTKAKGMGFGLPICKRIVEAHNGKISLKSTLGKGTTVTITIPANPKPTDESEEKWIFNESILRAMRTAQETS